MLTLIAKCVFALILGAIGATGVKKAGAAMELTPAMIDFARWLIIVVTVLVVLYLLWNGRGVFVP